MKTHQCSYPEWNLPMTDIDMLHELMVVGFYPDFYPSFRNGAVALQISSHPSQTGTGRLIWRGVILVVLFFLLLAVAPLPKPIKGDVFFFTGIELVDTRKIGGPFCFPFNISVTSLPLIFILLKMIYLLRIIRWMNSLHIWFYSGALLCLQSSASCYH